MLIIDGVKYNLWIPKNERHLEEVVKEHFDYIFGKNSLYFDIKPELRSKAGIGSKPDGIVVVFDKPSFYVVEIERAEHGVHDHVVTQISKFNTALKKSPETRMKIAEAIYNDVVSDPSKQFFAKSRVKGELFKFLTDIFSIKPTVVIIIDELLDELKEAVDELPMESRILEFKTFERDGVGLGVHAHLFEPLYESVEAGEGGREEEKKYPPHVLSWEKRFAWVDESIKWIVARLTENIVELGEVTQRVHGRYLCFYKGKPSTKSIFAAFLLTKKALNVRIRTDPNTFRDPRKLTGDRVYKGWFFKQGQEREFKIIEKDQIDYAMELIKQSYDISGEKWKSQWKEA